MIKAQNLSISVPELGPCTKKCPYCISKMTGAIRNPVTRYSRDQILNAIFFAKDAGAQSLLITGKGEPLQNLESVDDILRCNHYCNKSFANVELQTNGLWLQKPENLEHSIFVSITNIAISVDSVKGLIRMAPVFNTLHDMGKVTRLTLNVTPMLQTTMGTFKSIINYCVENQINQLLMRKITKPAEKGHDTPQAKWIDKNKCAELYDSFNLGMHKALAESGVLLRSLNHGEGVWDYHGISCVAVDYCLQAKTQADETRSLILMEDGHVRTHWDYESSIIF
jgi:molybdenum cofactor biosynthesis enzyme MoaA